MINIFKKIRFQKDPLFVNDEEKDILTLKLKDNMYNPFGDNDTSI